jgi:hypothetical protein
LRYWPQCSSPLITWRLPIPVQLKQKRLGEGFRTELIFDYALCCAPIRCSHLIQIA